MKRAVSGIFRKKKSGVDHVLALVSEYFDRDFYLSENADVRDAGMDPVQHYMLHGHAEGRDPTPGFSTAGYKARYPDVVESGMNPFYHYLKHGRFENRQATPAVTYTSVLPDEIVVQASEIPVFASPANDTGAVHGISGNLEGLDYPKVNRLLGFDVAGLQPRAWRIGVTSVLSRANPSEPQTAAAPAASGEQADGAQLVQDILSAAAGRTLSLDVWDTILRRDCSADAIKLRHARAQWLTRVDRDGPLGSAHPVDLLQFRRIAEADVADEHFEYRIGDVAERLAPLFRRPGEDYKASFLAQEIRIERSSISLDGVLAGVLAGHQGRKIVLSDFYMPGTALEELLHHVGVTNIDVVYSSSDHMATKRAGDLYDVALRNEGLDGQAVLHVGDRFSADVSAARKRGLQAFHYFSPSHQPRLERLDRAFWSHVDENGAVAAGDIAALLGHQAGDTPGLEMLSVAVTGFVLHVMEEALRRRIDTVFFMTREGVFFKRVYDRLVELDVFDLGSYPGSKVLEVSRRATFAASLQDFAVEPLMRLWSQYSTQSIRALATTLNIAPAKWEKAAARFGFDLDTPIVYPWQNAQFRSFMADSQVVQAARHAIAQQSANLVAYLDAIGFEPRAEQDRLIVDIGWRGTIQDNLAEIVSGQVHGCYFGLESFINPQPANVSKTGYVFDVNRGFPLAVPEVAGLEFLFNAPGGSTVGYADGKALRDIVDDEEAIVTGPVAVLQDRLIGAVEKVAGYVKRHGLISHDIASFAREAVAEFTQNPPPEVAEAFFDLVHNESFGVGGTHSMKADQSGLASAVSLQGADLHGQIAGWLAGVRWPAAAQQLPAFRALREALSVSQRLHLPAAPAIVRASSLGQDRIAVLSPPPIKGSGGHRTIFNLTAALARHGYDVHLMHERPSDPDTDAWIGTILGDAPVTQHGEWLNWMRPTASVATIWYSADYPRQYWADDTTQFYFVQDYEAMFNPMGDTYLRAGQSYSWGARHLCVGRWLAHSLRSEFGVGVASGGLGVDHKVYRPLDDVTRNPAQIALLFQPEKYRRAPELCAAALSIVKARLPETRIVLYGSDHRPHLPFEHEHLGLITDVREINKLYNESAVGLCISSTNPSRIPFEMMASGCVPVDIYRYNNLFDYDAGAGVLAHESAESVAEAILGLLTDPGTCAQRAQRGYESVRHRSLEWEMDVAVNGVEMGLAGFDFDQIDPVAPSYTDAPVIAAEWDTKPVRHYMQHQWRLANGL